MVSILLPVKNGAKYLQECISSILGQSFKDWELIIIDDHSSDSTAQIIKKNEQYDSRIKSYSNQGSGVIDALRHALNESSGEYITRIDSDDIMPVDRLEKMVNKLEQSPENTIVTGLVKYFGNEPISNGYKQYEDWINQVNLSGQQWQNIYRECVVASPNWMVRRSKLINAGGFDDLKYPEDYHLVLRWYQNHYDVECIPEITLWWREHPDRISRNSDNYSQKAFFELKIGEFLRYEDSGKNLVLWGAGTKGKLTAYLFKESKRNFIWMDNIPSTRKVDDGTIYPYTDIENIKDPQLLISVYPSGREREELEKYLNRLNLIQGEHYWYL